MGSTTSFAAGRYTFNGSSYDQVGGTFDDDNTLIEETNDDTFVVDENVNSTASGSAVPFEYIYKGLVVDASGNEYLLFEDTTQTNVFWLEALDTELGASTFPANIPVGSGVGELQESNYSFCFGPGTAISTPDGEVDVEALGIGDRVLTTEGRMVPVKWIGRQRVRPRLPISEKHEPVRIAAGALGDGLPHSDLTVSADHGMILGDMVVNASAMVNGTTVAFIPLAELGDDFTYFHIETEKHDVILANGAPAETFVDIPGRMAFDNYQEYLDLYGAERIIPEMDRPRIASRRLLPDAIKARLGIVEEMIEFDAVIAA